MPPLPSADFILSPLHCFFDATSFLLPILTVLNGSQRRNLTGPQCDLPLGQGKSGRGYWYGPQNRRLYAAAQHTHAHKLFFGLQSLVGRRRRLTDRVILSAFFPLSSYEDRESRSSE